VRTLAVDLGTKRIGLALSDEGGRFATPLEVISVTSPDQAFTPILNLIGREGVTRVVLGLPLNMDDSFGDAARRTIAWGRGLAERARVEVVFVDERLSSFAAEQQLIDRKRGGERITRADKKQRLDALAAAGFLQEFLDGRLPPIDVDALGAGG
jgi:putative Holliday junction resolvase